MPVYLNNGLKCSNCLPVFILMISILFLLPAVASSIPYPDAPRISTSDLEKMLGDAGLIIIDVRIDSQWQVSDVKIPGAVHENPVNIDWADKYPKDSVIVTY